MHPAIKARVSRVNEEAIFSCAKDALHAHTAPRRECYKGGREGGRKEGRKEGRKGGRKGREGGREEGRPIICE